MQPLPTTEAWLVKDDQQSVPLRGNCSLGRSAENQVVVPSDRASRRHAIIHAQGHEYWLVDLGSKNKTFLNERHVTHPTLLKDGDLITIAGHSFAFRQNAPAMSEEEELQQSQMTVMDLRTDYCWIVIADLVNFTALSQRLPADELADLVGRWVRTCKEQIEQNGGVINKYLGDGFMAFWRGGTKAVEPVVAALQGLRRAQSSFEMEFRIVVHYGRVSIGGAAAIGEESLMGPELNFAFRTEKVAGGLQEKFFCSSPVEELLRSQLTFEAIPGEHAVKDFPGAHRFFRLV